MRSGSIYLMAAAASLALILLVTFQVKWLSQSRELIEAQFEQQVTMAMCNAVENVADVCGNDKAVCQAVCSPNTPENNLLRTAVDKSMQCYNINMPYKLDVVSSCGANPTAGVYTSIMAPSIFGDEQYVQVRFPEKKDYVSQKMGFMVGSSVFILLFLGAVFLTALLALFRQKQLNDISIAFFNNMAHEFRTPLTNIGLAINRMRKKTATGQEQDERYLNIIQGESGRLLEQVERILHVAQLERGNYLMEKSPIDLTSLVREVVEDMKLQAGHRNADIAIDDRMDQSFALSGDRLHLSNAIRNVLDNALKYCDTNPRIAVKIQAAGAFAQLCVEDNGVGIPASDCRFVFQSFRRGRHTQNLAAKGFGLGLAYVKKVVAMHGGYVKVDSQPAQGTRFNMFIPINA